MIGGVNIIELFVNSFMLKSVIIKSISVFE